MNLSTILPLYSLNEDILSFMTLIILFIVLEYPVKVINCKTNGDNTLPDLSM